MTGQAVNWGRDEFTPFREPLDAGDEPILRPNGVHYRCTGCGGDIPGGMLVHTDTVLRHDEPMIVGMYAREGNDGPVTHACGTLTDMFDTVSEGLAARNARDMQRLSDARRARARVEKGD